MNLQKKLFTLLLLAGTSITLSADEAIRLIDRGLDGNERYYATTCPPDNSMGSIKVVFDFDSNNIPEVTDEDKRLRVRTKTSEPKVVQVCVYPLSGSKECRVKWDLDEAAIASCKKSEMPPLTDEQKKVLERPHLGV